MKSLIIVFFIATFLTSFKPIGSGTAYLICKSESRRTLFNAELQDIDGLLEKAQLTVDGKKLTFTEEDNAHTIFDPETGVITIYLEGKESEEFPNGRFIQFWSIPQSFKVLEADRHSQKYEFKAKIEATEPRKEKALRIPRVVLYCTLEYKI